MAFWLKRWGTEERPYHDGMLSDYLTFSDRAAPRGVPKVREGDQLIVTGVGTHGALVAVARATSNVSHEGQHPNWPWKCRADFYLRCAIADAPSIDVIPDPENKLRGWLKTGDGLRQLSAEQFAAAEAEIGKKAQSP